MNWYVFLDIIHAANQGELTTDEEIDGGNVPLGECESQRTLQFEAGLPVLRRVSGLADPAVGYSVPCICLF